jgi:hypothetical protein
LKGIMGILRVGSFAKQEDVRRASTPAGISEWRRYSKPGPNGHTISITSDLETRAQSNASLSKYLKLMTTTSLRHEIAAEDPSRNACSAPTCTGTCHAV